MAKKLLFLLAACFIAANAAFAQVTVSGKVLDATDGSPIIGASVIVDKSNPMKGASTDIDGNFSISGIPTNLNTITVSYVGMKTKQVAIGKGGIFTIRLESDAEVLDDVVVTALGISREKKSLGYAQQEIGAEELAAAAPVSITSALAGKAAGTQITTMGGTVGASAVISIRGNSSLAENQQPLIVVDGVPINNNSTNTGDGYYKLIDFGSGLNDINVEDIESVDILKGGAAALYGMRAANGVILITTKKGSKKQGTQVSYDGSITFDQVANIPKLQNKYGQGYYGDEYYYSLYGEGMTYAEYAQSGVGGFSYVDGAGNGLWDGMDESWGPRLDQGINLVQFDSNGEATPWVSRKNNVKDFFQTGVTQNHMVSIATHSDNVNLRASLSYRGQRGTVPNTDQKRYGGLINADVKLNKQVWMDVNANYTFTKSDNIPAQGYGTNNPMISLLEWTGRQVNMKSLKDNWDQKDELGNYTMYNWNQSFHLNPYFNVNMNTNSFRRHRFYGKGSMFYQPFEWLKFEGRLGVDTYNSKSLQRVYTDSDYPNGYFDQQITENTEFNADFIATANKTFNRLSVLGMLGANYRDNSYSWDDVEADGLTVPGVYTIANATSPVSDTDHSHTRSNSIYGSVSLGWDNYLYADITARNDWSSTLDDSFFYPSVSLSFLPLTAFNASSDVLNFLKIRGGYAEVGSATSAYRNSAYYYASTAAFNGTTLMYKQKSAPNYNLKPERARTWEAGIELGMFNNRLHLDLAYYSKSTKDQILYVTTPQSSGITSKLINAGELTNKGIEIQLSGDIIKTKDFTWSSTFNFSKDKSKVKSLADGLDYYSMGWTWGISTIAKAGSSWGDLMGTAYERTEDGSIILDASGMPTEVSSQVIGNITPKALLSWRHDFKYKDWSAGFMLDMRIGGDLWSQTMNHAYAAGTAKVTADNGIRERALIPGVDMMKNHHYVLDNGDGTYTDYATAVANGQASTVSAQDWFEWMYTANETYVFDGSFLKWREFYLTYTFPKAMLKKTKYISGASISFVANNIALLWVDSSNTMRIDPESGGVTTTSYGIGLEQSSVPSSRSFGFKVNLTF